MDIGLTATAVPVAPCQLAVTPKTLNFGVVTPPVSTTLPFEVRNVGTASDSTCFLSPFEVENDDAGVYSLAAGTSSLELPPGASEKVEVALVAPSFDGGVLQHATADVRFEVSSPTRPVETVNLDAWLGPSCVVIAPESVDFGTVKLGCRSQPRTVDIYNGCTGAITLTNFAITDGAGYPAGTPGKCPGAQPCPEFNLVSAPST